MANMTFGKMENDVGEPAGIVIRDKDDGQIDLTIIDGDNERINTGLFVLSKVINVTGLEPFLAMAKGSLIESGIDVDALLAESQSEEGS